MKQLNWYQIFGKSKIPDGRTVTPTDDIQIWLHCADIWDKTYTTLGEVLNDTDTLSALMASDNAVDYLVRSTSWAVPISIPTMTSNTTPSGMCSATSTYSGRQPYYAFDKSTSNSWMSADNAGANCRLVYGFSEAVKICKASFYTTGATVYESAYKVQGSHDGVNWTDLYSGTFHVNADPYGINESVEFDNNTAYEYYGLFFVAANSVTGRSYMTEFNLYSASITDNATAMSLIGQNNYAANTLLADATWCEAICNSEYFESVLNVKVPVMTSNTTPSGVCFGSGSYSSSYDFWNAFDRNSSSRWASVAYQVTNQHIGYEFSEPIAVARCSFSPLYSSGKQTVKNYRIEVSNDGNTWDVIASDTLANSNVGTVLKVLNYSTAKKYVRLFIEDSYSTDGISIYELQFYGRKDI